MNIIENLCTTYKTRIKKAPMWIVIHYPGCVASAQSLCKSMAREKEKEKQDSVHYIIDGKSIIHAVDESKYYAWHCATSGKIIHCGAKNDNSIGIEMCARKMSCETVCSTDNDWYFEDKTWRNSVELIATLMLDHAIDIDHVVRHYDVTHKICPAPFCGSIRNRFYGISGERLWMRFKEDLQSKLEDKINEKKLLQMQRN